MNNPDDTGTYNLDDDNLDAANPDDIDTDTYNLDDDNLDADDADESGDDTDTDDESGDDESGDDESGDDTDTDTDDESGDDTGTDDESGDDTDTEHVTVVERQVGRVAKVQKLIATIGKFAAKCPRGTDDAPTWGDKLRANLDEFSGSISEALAALESAPVDYAHKPARATKDTVTNGDRGQLAEAYRPNLATLLRDVEFGTTAIADVLGVDDNNRVTMQWRTKSGGTVGSAVPCRFVVKVAAPVA